MVRRLYTKIIEFNTYMDSIKTEKDPNDNLNLDEKIDFVTQSEIFDGKCCLTIKQGADCDDVDSVSCRSLMMTPSSRGMGGKSYATERKKENWRKLKPNTGSPNVFTRTVNNMSYRFPAESSQHSPTTHKNEKNV